MGMRPPHSSQTLAARERGVLLAVMEQYISSAEPVGSLDISKRSKEAVSAATVRNVMARLEDDGYLAQPHTSAGRVPTSKGVRYYIDRLMRRRVFGNRERERIEQKVFAPDSSAGIEARAARGLAEIAVQIGVIAPATVTQATVNHLEFVRAAEKRFVVILVLGGGNVQHRVFSVDFDLTAPEVDRINGYARELVGGSLADMRQRIATELQRERAQHDALYRHALELGQFVSGDAQPALLVEGALLCFQHPEFAQDADRMRHLLQTLEDKALLLALLDRLQDVGAQVLLGDELGDETLRNMALVAARYQTSDGGHGVLGLLGPLRMDYSRLVPLVDFSSGAMTKHLLGRDE